MYQSANRSYTTPWSSRVSNEVRKTLEERRSREASEKRQRQGMRRMFVFGIMVGIAVTKFFTPVVAQAAQL